MSTRNGSSWSAISRERLCEGGCMTEGAVAGVDWAKDAHEVLVADREGERLWGETVSHDEAGIARLCKTLVTLGVVRVAVERPDGLLIERLLDAGLTVLAIHPNMVAAARDGSAPRREVRPLRRVRALRARPHRQPPLPSALARQRPDQGAPALTRGREVLVEQRVALCNQLRAELERFWPGAPRSSPTWTARSRSRSSRATQPRRRTRPRREAPGDSSSPATTTAGADPRPAARRLRNAPTGRVGEIEAEARRGSCSPSSPL